MAAKEQPRLKKLSARALRGVFQLQLFLAMVLFLSAWSFHYWEAWTYLSVFSVFALFTTIYFLQRDPALIERRMKAGRCQSQKIQKVIQAIASVMTLAIFAVAGVDHRLHWSSVTKLSTLVAYVTRWFRGCLLSSGCLRKTALRQAPSRSTLTNR